MTKQERKAVRYVKNAKRGGAKWDTVKQVLARDFGMTEIQAMLFGATYFARNKS
jgi:hypothetical protein